MILDDVARDAGAVEVVAALFHADRFRDRDLHMVNILTIPERLEDPVGEAQNEQVLNRFFAEVMVDAEDLALAEGGHRDAVQLLRRLQVMPERLLDDHPRERAAALRIADHLLGAEQLRDDGKKLRRHRQVVNPPPARPPRAIALLQPLIQLVVGLRLAEIALDIKQSLGEAVPDRVVDRPRASELVARVAHGHAKGVVGVVRPREADDRLSGRQQTIVRQ